METLKKLNILLFSTTLMLSGITLSFSLYGQSVPAVSVGPQNYFPGYIFSLREKPARYNYTGSLKEGEMHKLGNLTPAERARIEGQVEPPAVGVVRDPGQP